MKIKTILGEDEIQITLTTSELVWLQVFLGEVISIATCLPGWKSEAATLHAILYEVKKEGKRVLPTTKEYEESGVKFLEAEK